MNTLKTTLKLASTSLTGILLATSSAHAVTQIEVTFTSVGPVGFAPLFTAFHDGGYDLFNPGGTASAALETLAEVGDPGALISSVPAGVNEGPVFGTNPSPPVFTVSGSNSAISALPPALSAMGP